jgi:hypothetical protein
MASDNKRRLRQTGRSSTQRYVGIPKYVWDSEEFASLDGWCVKLLVEIAGAYNGHNNGDLSCAWSVLRKRGWRSTGTLCKALDHLRATNWIVTTRHGNRSRCALYALTWAAIDDCPGKGLEVAPTRTASNAWQKSKSLPAM